MFRLVGRYSWKRSLEQFSFEGCGDVDIHKHIYTRTYIMTLRDNNLMIIHTSFTIEFLSHERYQLYLKSYFVSTILPLTRL